MYFFLLVFGFYGWNTGLPILSWIISITITIKERTQFFESSMLLKNSDLVPVEGPLSNLLTAIGFELGILISNLPSQENQVSVFFFFFSLEVTHSMKGRPP